MYAGTKIASQGALPPNTKKKRKKKASQTPHHGRIFPHQSKRHKNTMLRSTKGPKYPTAKQFVVAWCILLTEIELQQDK